jgi:Spy/CpxP family protein refolding chaperone
MEVPMSKKIFAIAMALSLISAAAFAQGKGPRGGEPKGMKGDMKNCMMMQGSGMMGKIDIDALKQQLKLTDEQVNKINTLHLNHKKEMLKYKEALAPKEIRIQRLLLDDPVNFEEVKALIMDISKTHGEMQVERLKYRLDVEKILTPEQRVTFKSMRGPKGQKMMGDRMKMGDKMKKGNKVEHQH